MPITTTALSTIGHWLSCTHPRLNPPRPRPRQRRLGTEPLLSPVCLPRGCPPPPPMRARLPATRRRRPLRRQTPLSLRRRRRRRLPARRPRPVICAALRPAGSCTRCSLERICSASAYRTVAHGNAGAIAYLDAAHVDLCSPHGHAGTVTHLAAYCNTGRANADAHTHANPGDALRHP